MENLQEKAFELVKKMETDGYELLKLDADKKKVGGEYSLVWFAEFVKDDIHYYIEIEKECTATNDLKLVCPKCGRNKYDDGTVDGWDFCPDCEFAPVYKKEIHADYFSLQKSIKSRAFKEYIVKQTLININELHKIKLQIEDQERAYLTVLEEMAKS